MEKIQITKRQETINDVLGEARYSISEIKYDFDGKIHYFGCVNSLSGISVTAIIELRDKLNKMDLTPITTNT